MRLRDAKKFPGKRMRFHVDTRRSLLHDFLLSESDFDDDPWKRDVLHLLLRFVDSCVVDHSLITRVAHLTNDLRTLAAPRDFGNLSYGLTRAIVGELELITVSFYSTLLNELSALISMNATAFHRDEYLEPEDVFKSLYEDWRIRASPFILGLLDLSGLQQDSSDFFEKKIWFELKNSHVDMILDSIRWT